MTTYDVPDEILVTSDGPIRVITLNRPENLNATNHVLHAGLAGLWPQLDADEDARVAVLTGGVVRSRPVGTSTTSTNCRRTATSATCPSRTGSRS